MSVYKKGDHKVCGNCSMSMDIISEKDMVICDLLPSVFSVVGWCSKWKPELEPDKSDEPEQMDEKSREAWLKVGELLVEREKKIKEQQETIVKLRKIVNEKSGLVDEYKETIDKLQITLLKLRDTIQLMERVADKMDSVYGMLSSMPRL